MYLRMKHRNGPVHLKVHPLRRWLVCNFGHRVQPPRTQRGPRARFHAGWDQTQCPVAPQVQQRPHVPRNCLAAGASLACADRDLNLYRFGVLNIAIKILKYIWLKELNLLIRVDLAGVASRPANCVRSADLTPEFLQRHQFQTFPQPDHGQQATPSLSNWGPLSPPSIRLESLILI